MSVAATAACPNATASWLILVDDVASGIEASNSGSLMRVDDYVANLITFRTQVDSQFRAYGAAHRGVDGIEDAHIPVDELDTAPPPLERSEPGMHTSTLTSALLSNAVAS
nr:hypothetical protein [Mesorhizobium escarrei]